MKLKIFIHLFCFCFFSFILPAFSNEIASETNKTIEASQDEEKADDDSTKMFFPAQNVRPRLRNAASIRPKNEQIKSKTKAEADLAKNRAAFEKRVYTELMLLRDEQDLLEYRP